MGIEPGDRDVVVANLRRASPGPDDDADVPIGRARGRGRTTAGRARVGRRRVVGTHDDDERGLVGVQLGVAAREARKVSADIAGMRDLEGGRGTPLIGTRREPWVIAEGRRVRQDLARRCRCRDGRGPIERRPKAGDVDVAVQIRGVGREDAHVAVVGRRGRLRSAGHTGGAEDPDVRHHPGSEDDDEGRRVDIELGRQQHAGEISLVVAGMRHLEGILHLAGPTKAGRQPRVAGECGRIRRGRPRTTRAPRDHEHTDAQDADGERRGRHGQPCAARSGVACREGGHPSHDRLEHGRVDLTPLPEPALDARLEVVAHRRSSASYAARRRSIA